MERLVKAGVARALIFAMVSVFSVFVMGVPRLAADTHSHSEETVEITVKVTEKGFFDEKKRLIGPKNPLKIPAGEMVKLTFVFDEAINSLAIGDVHQIAITAEDKWTIESEKIWALHNRQSVTFRAGENGRMRYRAHCILDCIGMEQLNNLVIEVLGHQD
jgi:hypothetical protein